MSLPNYEALLNYHLKKLYIIEVQEKIMTDFDARILKAEEFARKRHKNQMKKDRVTSQIEHVEGVVFRLKNIGITDADVICAAWLHDILEKTDTSLEEIIQRFGKRTATLVLSVTKDIELSKQQMENQYIKQLREAPIEAKIIKLCDISSNIRDLSNSSLSKTQKNKQIRKFLHYLRVIKSELSQEKAHYQKIQDIVDGINLVSAKFKQRPVLI